MLNKLTPPEGSKKKRKRVGRGPGCHGKTSGRGHKGQGSRSGGTVAAWFEGGQTPLKLRSPKRGFKNPLRVFYDVINLGDLDRFAEGDVITPDALKKAGLVSGKNPIKILGDGELKHILTVRAHKFSKSAALKLEERGGHVEVI